MKTRMKRTFARAVRSGRINAGRGTLRIAWILASKNQVNYTEK
jgi:hypothetical protein